MYKQSLYYLYKHLEKSIRAMPKECKKSTLFFYTIYSYDIE